MATVSMSWNTPAPRAVAPRWHTLVLMGFFVLLTAAGALRQSMAPAGPAATAPTSQVLPLYLSLIAGEWGLVWFVWKAGLRRTGTPLASVIGGRWASARDVLRDVGLAVGLWGAWALVSFVWERLSGPSHAASISGYLPHGALEAGLWIALSASAGFAEEFVFRGYLQRQFLAWTKSPWIALVLQAALFGVSHGYQGVAACVHIAVFGVLYGLFAMWRGSLRPGMIGHALTDVMAGLFRL